MNARDSSIPAVILVGGQGTRLRATFPDIPKALVPVAGRPVLERLVDWLAEGGITRVHLAAGHMAKPLERWVQAFHHPGVSLSMSVEPAPLGTAGAVRFCAAGMHAGAFLVLNGDSFLPELDFRALLAFHETARAAATLAVTPIEDAGRYGTVQVEENRVAAFREKAHHESGYVNGGVYVMTARVLEGIPAGTNCSLETEVFPRLAERGDLAAFRVPPPLLDMGTPEGLERLSRRLG